MIVCHVCVACVSCFSRMDLITFQMVSGPGKPYDGSLTETAMLSSAEHWEERLGGNINNFFK